MHAIEEHEPFGQETTGPRVLRNANNIRNRVKREGRRAGHRVDSHQRLYTFVHQASKYAIQLGIRVISNLPMDAVKPRQSSGSPTPDVTAHAIIVISDAFCVACEALFDAIGEECETMLQTTTPTTADAPPSTTATASSPLRVVPSASPDRVVPSPTSAPLSNNRVKTILGDA